MVTNLQYFYETSRKVRGGKHVWVKDSNGENRSNILLGGTIGNPNKGFGRLFAAQLMQYTPGQPMLIFRSFKLKTAAAANATVLYFNGDGYSDAPEVGQYIMVAPDDTKVETFTVADTTVTKSVSDYKGKYAKITDVEYNESDEKFKVTIDTALSDAQIAADTILVEADKAADTESTGSTTVLCPTPNVFNEADRDLLPTEGYGVENASYSASGVYDKKAWIARMQPLPKYVLKLNRSLIEGIFWV